MAGLKVSSVDFRIVQNAAEHVTSRYELVHQSNPSPVLRRGRSFTLQINFQDGIYDPTTHGLSIVFDHYKARVPNREDGTQVEVILDDTNSRWKAMTKERHGHHIVVEVQTPSDTLIGLWYVKFLTWHQGALQHTHDYPGGVYLLFHPWNSADQVSMQNQKLLDEYVYKDIGKVYQKKGENVVGDPWIYGQFDEVALTASIKMLYYSGLMAHEFKDPVKLARAVTHMANGKENPKGVLEGAWKEVFEPGTIEPKEWTSSLDILRKYLDDDAPVQYGQCWVFAAIVTTVCRSLGLACRNVTMITSPHDYDDDMAASQFFDKNNVKGKHPIYAPGTDQEWTFHAWNEVWMARPELPHIYSGWQAIDGTPQSKSEGLFQCGPAPLEAIKRGEIDIPYDIQTFVVASNADLVRWREFDGEFRLIESETSRYGVAAYTKKPHTFDPHSESDVEDVIHNYKFPEGSLSERLFLMNAVGKNPKARIIYGIPKQSWQDSFSIVANEVPFVALGREMLIPFRIKNRSQNERVVLVSISADSIFYNGAKGHHMGKVEDTLTLGPGQELTMSLQLNQRDYVGKLVEYGNVNIYAVVTTDSAHAWVKEIKTGFNVPAINFQPLGHVRLHQRHTLWLTIKNPMDVALTMCRFLFFAPGITVAREKAFRVIQPQEEVTVGVEFTPTKSGQHTITATFKCRETVDFYGRIQIEA
ncbi:hemocyte protein-glutamine gamma-glutamyltransferase-like [Ischnura elegans]|uniref:hemocyte protein-glutamine gamma-glutamyltransferase-like n=1 Tax=Ischnura elegans TaxID=197161 RepID=UPI001ED899B1|nr:hemocyte protein-glutamine gamma-glutamyltransferase-like [Ischnura elegans]